MVHALSVRAARLLDHHVDLVAVLHLERLRRVVLLNALAVENEATLIIRQALALAVGVHQLLELRRLFDFEEDLSPILRLHFDVELLACCACCACGPCSCGSLVIFCSSFHRFNLV